MELFKSSFVKQKFDIKQWLLVGLLLRLIVMPFTVHSDLIHISMWPHILLHGNWDVFGEADRSGANYYAPLLLIYIARWCTLYIFQG